MSTDENPKKRKSAKKKTLADIKVVDLEGQPAYSITDAAVYVGKSPQGLRLVLNKHPEIVTQKLGFTRETYVYISDLDRLKTPRPAPRKQKDEPETEGKN